MAFSHSFLTFWTLLKTCIPCVDVSPVNNRPATNAKEVQQKLVSEILHKDTNNDNNTLVQENESLVDSKIIVPKEMHKLTLSIACRELCYVSKKPYKIKNIMALLLCEECLNYDESFEEMTHYIIKQIKKDVWLKNGINNKLKEVNFSHWTYKHEQRLFYLKCMFGRWPNRITYNFNMKNYVAGILKEDLFRTKEAVKESAFKNPTCEYTKFWNSGGPLIQVLQEHRFVLPEEGKKYLELLKSSQLNLPIFA